MARRYRTPPMKRPPASKAAATRSLAALARAARDCRACDLWRDATQTVFGEGPADARFFIIGEQAGDQEDRSGHPFVGPAGGLLDKALAEAGIARKKIYVTNVIKHFKFELRGKRRIHKRADAAEIAACLQWLERELDRLQPRYVVCLGAMAAKVMLGNRFALLRQRGSWIAIDENRWCLATVHPAYVLRNRADFAAAYAAFVADLKQLRRLPD
jgi:DNA polymerase